MNRTTIAMTALVGIAFGTLSVLFPAVAAGQVLPDRGEYYIAPLAGIQLINFPSFSNIDVGTSFGVALGAAFGIGVLENLSIEPEFSLGFGGNAGTDAKAEGGQDVDFAFGTQIGVAGNLMYFFPSSGRATPYVTGGFGFAHTGGLKLKAGNAEQDLGGNTDPLIMFGGGVDAIDIGRAGSMRLDGRLGLMPSDGTELILRFGVMLVFPVGR